MAALTHGFEKLREGFPLSLRLIREIHGVLLAEGRGSEKAPGELRRSQNWIGGSRRGNAMFVLPPPELVMDCMGQLEQFLYEERPDLPLIVKAALVHVRFESIHPFLDGNGRLGRLLITLLRWVGRALGEPILYLSLYFRTHRSTYCDLLNQARFEAGWKRWIEFFLTGLKETSDCSTRTAENRSRWAAHGFRAANVSHGANTADSHYCGCCGET